MAIFNEFYIEAYQKMGEGGGRIFNNKACRMCHDTTFKRFRQKMVNCACKSKRRRTMREGEEQILFKDWNFRSPILITYALSFYRSQNVLCRSKFFVPDQKFIYILWQSQKFCSRQKDDLHSVKLVFVPAQKFLKRH